MQQQVSVPAVSKFADCELAGPNEETLLNTVLRIKTGLSVFLKRVYMQCEITGTYIRNKSSVLIV